VESLSHREIVNVESLRVAETAGAVGSPQDYLLPNPDTDTTKPKTKPTMWWVLIFGGDGGI